MAVLYSWGKKPSLPEKCADNSAFDNGNSTTAALIIQEKEDVCDS
jgi:hypothetical protein